MGLVFLIVGIIAGAIYNVVSDNGFNTNAGWGLIIVFMIVGCVMESIFGNFVGLIFLFILFAGWALH